MTRRDLLRAALGAAAFAAGCRARGSAQANPEERSVAVRQTVLPRWRGFNVHNMFGVGGYEPFREDEFEWMADWGFDFVRLPVSHVLVITEGDAERPNERGLAEVDRGVEFARKHGLHANLDLHTAPGYAYHESQLTNGRNLWKDESAQADFCQVWRRFAERYRGIPSTELSFNLLNEPAASLGRMTRQEHERVIRGVVAAIREVDPERLLIADGLEWAREPLPELADLGIAQSYHFYDPHQLTHYRAGWAGPDAMRWPTPQWPDERQRWDRAHLEGLFRPWLDLIAQGVGVHAGEGGVYNKTPHPAALGWLRDMLEVLREHNVGYAIWNLRGPFGVLDSGRSDVDYEDFHGHQLDRKMLELLQGT